MNKAVILKVFSRYNLILQSAGTRWLVQLLEHFADEDPETILTHMAAALSEESGPIGVVELERTYEKLQVSGNQPVDANDAANADLDELPDQLIKVINAFDMPRIQWNLETSTLERSTNKPSMLGASSFKASYLRDRYSIIKQTILRSEHFSPPALPGHDRSEYLQLTGIKNLLGRQGNRFLLFGMLTRIPSGSYALEDLDDTVALNLSEANPAVGLFTEGCFVLVDGIYELNSTFTVNEMAHPPSEGRKIARSIFGHLDNLGIGAVTLAEEAAYQKLEQSHPNSIVVISDLYLDLAKVLASFKQILTGYEDAAEGPTDLPCAFVLCGNFCSRPFILDGKASQVYKNGFTALADIIAQFPKILSVCHFILVPGPTDPFDSTTLPRPPLPASLTGPLKSKVPNLHLASNPCRILFLGQEIVVFREDLMAKMNRNVILSKNAHDREMEEQGRVQMQSSVLQEYLVQTVLDQAHLVPLSLTVKPVLWEFDHTLRLYPMPTTLVLADHSATSFDLTYELGEGGADGKCHVFNPGSFLGSHCGWRTYHTDTRISEQSELPDV